MFNTARILVGDNRKTLATLEAGSVQTCITSPPYWGLRDYGENDQIGLEQTPDEYVEQLCLVFDEVWRVLVDDGTLWLNLGDSYNAAAPNRTGSNGFNDGRTNRDKRFSVGGVEGLKPKDLIGVPWRVAFALQSRGWYLRSEIIWHKPNPMPESVTDRPTKSHEHIFLLSKSQKYYYDHEAIKEPAIWADDPRNGGGATHIRRKAGKERRPNSAILRDCQRYSEQTRRVDCTNTAVSRRTLRRVPASSHPAVYSCRFTRGRHGA